MRIDLKSKAESIHRTVRPWQRKQKQGRLGRKTAKVAKKHDIYGGKIRTGVAGLDHLLGGGIPEGTSFLIHGVPHCGKKPFLMQTAHTAAKSGRPVVFILTDFGAESWKTMAAKGGWSLNKFPSRAFFVDCYSHQYGQCPTGKNITCIDVPFVLSSISIECSNFLDAAKTVARRKPLVIVHSLSTLLRNFGESEATKFLQFFVGKLKAQGVTAIYTLQAGMHSPGTEMMIRSLMDGVLDMKDSKLKASGFIGITNRDWVPYGLTGKGVTVALPKK